MAKRAQIVAAKHLETSISGYLSKNFEKALENAMSPEVVVGLSINAIDSALESMVRAALRKKVSNTHSGYAKRLRWLLAARALARAGSFAVMAGATISSNSVAERLGIGTAAVQRARVNGSLLGYRLPGEGVYRFPVFQFDGPSVVTWVPEVMALIGNGFAALHFLTVERKSLSGSSFLGRIMESPSPKAKRAAVAEMLKAARNLAA